MDDLLLPTHGGLLHLIHCSVPIATLTVVSVAWRDFFVRRGFEKFSYDLFPLQFLDENGHG
jgi:hypothetical protein